MLLKLLPLAFALGMVQLSTPADAASAVPERAGDFVAYCTSHFRECRSKIIEIDVAAMAGGLWGKDDITKVCAVPQDVDITDASKKILAWLTNNAAAADMTTTNGVHAAEKAIWNCR